MQKGDVVGGRLVPTDQYPPEAVQPTVSAFHHPAAGFEASFLLDGLGLFAPAADVRREAELVQGAAHLTKVVALIQAHTLGGLRTGYGSRHWQTVHRGPHQLHVVAVGSVHCQSHRNTLSFGQQAALDPALTPVGGIGPGFSPRPGALWSVPHPCSASSSPDLAIRRSVPVPSAIVPGIPRRPPIPGSANERWSRSRCPWRPTLSTGSRYAARRICHWRKSGRALGAGRRPEDGYSPVGESAGPAPPTARRIPERSRWWGWPVWPGQRAWVAVAWVLSL